MASLIKLPSLVAAMSVVVPGTAALAQATLKQPGVGMEKVDTQQAPPPTGITGDWGGLRTSLSDAGINAAASYVSETAGNYSGGTDQLVRETGQFALAFTADMARLAGLDGGTFQMTITDRRGDDLGAAANLGVLQQVQEVYGRGQTARLTQFWYEQMFDQGAFALKLGRATVGEDFDSFSCYFMNLSFCGSVPGNITNYWYNWPISQWTGRLRYNRENHYLQAAVYEINPHNLDDNFSFGKFQGATGVMIPVEAGWNPDPDATARISFYKIGGWYSNAPGDDVALDINHQARVLTGAPPLQRGSRYGVWFSGQQQVFGTAADGKFLSGLAVFLNVTVTDHRTSTIDDQIAGGVWWKGIIASLPDDVLGIGIARTHVNALVARNEELGPAGSPIQHAEYAGEIYYSLHPFEWIEMRPNLQLIHHPGGVDGAADVGVLGLKMAITL
ncbi:MAG TPA: carbohydrate porin [Rhizomicrobium sp.]